MTQELREQPRRIAARAGGFLQRLLRGLHTRLETDQILHMLRQALVELHQKIDRARALARDRLEKVTEQRCQRRGCKIGRELTQLLGLILEWKVLRVLLEKEIEWIEHGHFGDQIHLDPKLGRLVRKNEPREIVRLRILLPVDEMIRRCDAQGIRQHAGSRMRRRTQTDDLRPEADAAVILILSNVIERDVDGQARRPRLK